MLGYLCFAKNIQEPDKQKSRSRIAVHLGYEITQKSYLLYNLTSHVSFVHRDVIFKEDIFQFKLQKKTYTSVQIHWFK